MKYQHSPRMRRILRALAGACCPPQAIELDLLDDIVDHAELTIGAIPAPVRAALIAGLRSYDLAAMAVPRNRGRRAGDLDPERSLAYFESWWRSPVGLQREFAKGIKGILCLSHFEMPAIRDRLDYHPQAWIDKVKRYRLTTYSEDIERQYRSILARDPLPMPDDGALHEGAS